MSKRKALTQLGSQDKKIVANIANHFESQQCPSFIERTIEATGVSRRTLFRVRKELRETGKLTSPKRPSSRGAYKPIDTFDEAVIRNKIREFYEVRRQLPTLTNLLTVLKADIRYPGSKSLLQKTLKRMGFSWRRTTDNRKVLVERQAIVTQRLAFYERRKALQDDGFTFVYVDETWVDTSSSVPKCWQSEEICGVMPPCNRGQRLIVVHAGSRNGFIDGAQLVYKASSTTGDYHHEMNSTNFRKWLTERLIPNLPKKSAVVMDNASYHSVRTEKCPTTNTRKADIQNWLQKQGIGYRENMTKASLLERVRMNKPAPSYEIDQLIRSNGHEVLRLPPYHPELNAIELIWSQLKTIVRSRNLSFRLDDTLRLTVAAFSEIGEDRWRKACDHVEKTLTSMKAADHCVHVMTKKLIINLDFDTEDSSTDTASETESSSL